MESINIKNVNNINVNISQAENAKSTSSEVDINLVTTSGHLNENAQQTESERLDRQNDTVRQDLQMKPQGEETSSDTDTVILDSDEDLEILHDELISPPPVMLSPLTDSPVKPLQVGHG